MADRETVMYNIERCTCHVPDACRDCSYYKHGEYLDCMEELLKDALALLKEQKVKESKWLSLPYKKDRVCERCGHDEPYKFADKESDVFLYCPHCGAKMVNDR